MEHALLDDCIYTACSAHQVQIGEETGEQLDYHSGPLFVAERVRFSDLRLERHVKMRMGFWAGHRDVD